MVEDVLICRADLRLVIKTDSSLVGIPLKRSTHVFCQKDGFINVLVESTYHQEEIYFGEHTPSWFGEFKR